MQKNVPDTFPRLQTNRHDPSASQITREFFRDWKRKVGVVAIVIACVLMAGLLRCFVIESPPINTDRVVEDDEISGAGHESTSLDWTKYEGVLEERDPTAGSRSFWINGSPVRGKSKAYLEDPATWEGEGLVGNVGDDTEATV